MKGMGVFLLGGVLSAIAYYVFVEHADLKRVSAFGAIGVFVGLALVLGERITGLKVTGVGEITAATQRAIAGAERVEAIQKEIEAHRDSIAMIVRDANKAREDITRVDEYAGTAKKKTDELEKIVEQATKSQKELTRFAEFNMFLSRANNDDREAFDVLMVTANGAEEPFKGLSVQAIIKIATDQGSPIVFIPDWKKLNFDPDTATVAEYRQLLCIPRTSELPRAVDAFWSQERFTKRQRLEFLIETLRSTKSIRVLHAACMAINSEAKLDKNILAWGLYLEWWQKNSKNY